MCSPMDTVHTSFYLKLMICPYLQLKHGHPPLPWPAYDLAKSRSTALPCLPLHGFSRPGRGAATKPEYHPPRSDQGEERQVSRQRRKHHKSATSVVAADFIYVWIRYVSVGSPWTRAVHSLSHVVSVFLDCGELSNSLLILSSLIKKKKTRPEGEGPLGIFF
jgi:hypothetical protein